jgi:hypothetical protein
MTKQREHEMHLGFETGRQDEDLIHSNNRQHRCFNFASQHDSVYRRSARKSNGIPFRERSQA